MKKPLNRKIKRDYQMLAQRDLYGMSPIEVKNHIISNYQVDPTHMDNWNILIADEECGPYGCDSSSFFLLENKTSKDRELYENHASHCSCYGFEGQFKPEKTTVEYLLSPNSNISEYVREWLKNNLSKKVLDNLNKSVKVNA